MTLPKVSIIIVNYRQVEYTLECLTSLSKISYPRFETILVENDPESDNSKKYQKILPKIKILTSKTNLGFAEGNNLGFQACSGEFILLLNNDTKVEPNFLDCLVNTMLSDNSIGIAQSKIFVMDSPTLLDGFASFQTITGFLYHKGYLDSDKPEYNNKTLTFSAKGACILVRKSVLKLGLFDRDYFAYFEETDLCWRTWLLGYTVVFDPTSIVYHKMGATSSKLKSDFINYHSFKNRIRTIIKNSGSTTLVWMLPIHLVGCAGLSMFFLISGQASASSSILKAMWWNIVNMPNTLHLRKQVQKERIVSDSTIFSQVMKNPSLSFYLHHLSLIKMNLSR